MFYYLKIWNIRTAQANMHQYVIYIKLQNFDTTDVKCFTVVTSFFLSSKKNTKEISEHNRAINVGRSMCLGKYIAKMEGGWKGNFCSKS